MLVEDDRQDERSSELGISGKQQNNRSGNLAERQGIVTVPCTGFCCVLSPSRPGFEGYEDTKQCHDSATCKTSITCKNNL